MATDQLRRVNRAFKRHTPQSLVARSVEVGKVTEERQKVVLTNLNNLVAELIECESLLAVGVQPADDIGAIIGSTSDQLLKEIELSRKGKSSSEDLVRFLEATRRVNERMRVQQFTELSQSLQEALARAREDTRNVSSLLVAAEKGTAQIQDLKEKALSTASEQNLQAKNVSKIARQVSRSQELVIQTHRTAEAELAAVKETRTTAEGQARGVQAIQSELDRFSGSVAQHLQAMRQMQTHMDEVASEHERQKEDFLAALELTRIKADEILLRATAGSLYGAYGARKEELAIKVRQRLSWLYASVGGAVASSLSIWLISANQKWSLTDQYVAKIGVLTPFIFLIWFLTSQYNRERLLEEEYANKANMSVSYPAFRGDLLDLTSNGSESLKEQAVLAAIDISREIFKDPLDAFKRGKSEIKKLESRTKKTASEPEVGDTINELANKIGKVFESASNLIDKAAKLTGAPAPTTDVHPLDNP